MNSKGQCGCGIVECDRRDAFVTPFLILRPDIEVDSRQFVQRRIVGKCFGGSPGRNVILSAGIEFLPAPIQRFLASRKPIEISARDLTTRRQRQAQEVRTAEASQGREREYASAAV